MAKPIFRLKVVANNISWPSLQKKLDEVRFFYTSVCDLRISVVHTKLKPVFTTYPEIGPLAIVDDGWYDANISEPFGYDADILMFIVAGSDHIGQATYLGTMTYSNLGPWETTIFAAGEDDHTYVNGVDLGSTFELYACHELSHVFYAMLKKHDLTHVYFPGPPEYMGPPEYVLMDFKTLSERWFLLDYFTQQLRRALAFLNVLASRRSTVH